MSLLNVSSIRSCGTRHFLKKWTDFTTILADMTMTSAALVLCRITHVKVCLIARLLPLPQSYHLFKDSSSKFLLILTVRYNRLSRTIFLKGWNWKARAKRNNHNKHGGWLRSRCVTSSHFNFLIVSTIALKFSLVILQRILYVMKTKWTFHLQVLSRSSIMKCTTSCVRMRIRLSIAICSSNCS